MWRLAGCILESGKPLCAARSLRCVKSPLPPCLYSNRAGAERDARTRGGVESQRRKRERGRQRGRESERCLVCLPYRPASSLLRPSKRNRHRPSSSSSSPYYYYFFPHLIPLSSSCWDVQGVWPNTPKRGCLLIACYTLVNSPRNIC